MKLVTVHPPAKHCRSPATDQKSGFAFAIDERLQMQEAKRRNISVGKRDLRRAKSTIEKQNKLLKDGLERMLLQNDVPLAAMEEQLRAGIAWSKLVGRRLKQRITIGEDEQTKHSTGLN